MHSVCAEANSKKKWDHVLGIHVGPRGSRIYESKNWTVLVHGPWPHVRRSNTSFDMPANLSYFKPHIPPSSPAFRLIDCLLYARPKHAFRQFGQSDRFMRRFSPENLDIDRTHAKEYCQHILRLIDCRLFHLEIKRLPAKGNIHMKICNFYFKKEEANSRLSSSQIWQHFECE